ncbi:E3 ubiquitin-protein ligase SHPRH [Geosmithia morbida]|uniref:E3 ubiquitin-protein ligase SHPRH n=1 Tax=Geosmithia morbida TaxID=1094350 RepID=A0A9P5D184_9HYPO|nr:E3 ubiquitin-protein ligase SHPRH [Geosmithia morbida]KAF4120181.1 E3 ubiquitin-protein ligase SHPRH [Geosmithia morbida]
MAFRLRPQPVDIHDTLPCEIIDHITSLPTSEPGHAASDEHSSKRRKLDPERSRFCIATGALSFQRRLPSPESTPRVVERSGVGTYVRAFLEDQDLYLTLRPVLSGDRYFKFKIPLLSQHISDDARKILSIDTPVQTSSPGTVLTNVDVVMELKGTLASIHLDFQLFWSITLSPWDGFGNNEGYKRTGSVIDTFYPISDAPTAARSPMDFYESAFIPDKQDSLPLSIDIPDMDATLFPYQKRSLQWMLRREGVQWTGSDIESLPGEMPAPLSESSRIVQDSTGRDLILNDVFHTVSENDEPFKQVERSVRGGILAEEMGLGKTLEVLGLILLHRHEHVEMNRSTPGLISTGATLIVAPESLRQQWMSEISRHTPDLRLEFYQGCKREGGQGDAVARRLAQCDVVVTTYKVLSSEIHFAKDEPERSRRRERKYERPKSPLVQIMWWRLCLDEAQMIENGFSQAATVARTIPRFNAWGITGTPVKDDVKDLYGLLAFLQYEPLCSAPLLWQSLINGHKPIFQKLFNTISLRHTKALVRDEITLPPQRRFSISVPFSAVEEQHYQSLYKEMTEACGVDGEGNPVVDEWNPDEYAEIMRVWLDRLRQTALHPEVGAYSRRILGQNRTRPMRTVEEVLDAMIEQSENAIKVDYRMLLSHKLTRGQLFENSPRVKEAAMIWEAVRKETGRMVADARAELKAALGDKRANGAGSSALDRVENSGGSDDDEGPGLQGRIAELRRKLRPPLELHHKAVFFCANAVFQIRDNKDMTEPDSDEFHRLKKLEEEGYDEAKKIRREILRETHRKATQLMNQITRKANGQSFTEVSELVVKAERGIESGRIIDSLEMLYGSLNDQANVIDEWREHVVQLLLKPLLDEEEDVETTGEEMGDSAKIQEELIIYSQVLRVAVADRQDAMTGQTNELANHEAQVSIRMAKNDEGPMPEKLLELFTLRDKIKPQLGPLSMRGAISELRSLVMRLRNEPSQTDRVRMELSLASKLLSETQAALSEQLKASASLESEIESFRATVNARLEYYRQLQSVSDSVLPYEGPKTEETATKMAKNEEDLERKLAAAQAKHRYLIHLKEAGSKTNEPRICVICQMPFEMGVLTICGHQFCKECMMTWYKAHRNCPICKRHLSVSQLHDITMKPQELRLHGDETTRGENDSSDGGGVAQGDSRDDGDGITKKTMIYSTFNAEKLAEIKNIELEGPSYTTKVDTLVRHLLWLREVDPGAKSIVFSQYKGFLSVLATAFRRFRIGFASIDTHGGTTRFKEDPSVEVFLLHARAHSSGLNLVAANNVFLCEPLVNTALELQAIARVDRIGQQHETTVWLYVTSGTVEESIYNLGVKRRMEHMRRTQSNGTKSKSRSKDKGKGKGKDPRSRGSTPELLDANLEAANTLELEQATLSKLMSKDRSAGEMVDKGDLWECLFGHVGGSINGKSSAKKH